MSDPCVSCHRDEYEHSPGCPNFVPEECLGCGWSFKDGGEVYDIECFEHGDGTKTARAICGVCWNMPHSFHNGRSLPTEMRAIASATNVVLKALREKE